MLTKRTMLMWSASAVVAAATAAGARADDAKSLLWVQPLRDHPVHKLMQAGFLDRCKVIGYSCEVVGNPSASSYDVPATIPLAALLAAACWLGR